MWVPYLYMHYCNSTMLMQRTSIRSTDFFFNNNKNARNKNSKNLLSSHLPIINVTSKKFPLTWLHSLMLSLVVRLWENPQIYSHDLADEPGAKQSMPTYSLIYMWAHVFYKAGKYPHQTSEMNLHRKKYNYQIGARITSRAGHNNAKPPQYQCRL